MCFSRNLSIHQHFQIYCLRAVSSYDLFNVYGIRSDVTFIVLILVNFAFLLDWSFQGLLNL